MIVEYCFLGLIFLLLLIIGYFLISYMRYLKKKFDETEISVLFHMINSVTEQYKSQFFQYKYSKLVNKYDMKDDSPTKATDQFQKEYETLLKESTNEIINLYFSDELKKKAFKYFTLDSLLLYIISSLRG